MGRSLVVKGLGALASTTVLTRWPQSSSCYGADVLSAVQYQNPAAILQEAGRWLMYIKVGLTGLGTS